MKDNKQIDQIRDIVRYCDGVPSDVCANTSCTLCKAKRLYEAGCRMHEEVEHIQDIISALSDIRAQYSIFDVAEHQKYLALSVAIRVLNEIKEE